jgi:hypothetical protein
MRRRPLSGEKKDGGADQQRADDEREIREPRLP